MVMFELSEIAVIPPKPPAYWFALSFPVPIQNEFAPYDFDKSYCLKPSVPCVDVPGAKAVVNESEKNTCPPSLAKPNKTVPVKL